MQQNEYSNMRFDPRVKVMVSISPIPCKEDRDYGRTPNGGRTKYVLPAAEKGSYSKLEIYDSFQKTYDPMQSEPGKPSFQPRPVTANEIANDLMQQWVFNIPGGTGSFRPGIMIIDGLEPTAEELAYLAQQQRGYAEFMVHDAQQSAERHEWKKITDLHRHWAVWINYQPASGESNWTAKIGSEQIKQCVKCFERIDIRASICKTCKSDQPMAEALASEVRRGPGRPAKAREESITA